MEVEEKFVLISGLLCEPARAKMLWQLLDAKAFSASELAIAADISPTAASNHLSKLLEADIIKVETQGRHRYYSLSNSEVAYVVEALANLANIRSPETHEPAIAATGIRYCRTCYDHLAGFVSIKIVEAMLRKGYLKKSDTRYMVTDKGWKWLAGFDIFQSDFSNSRRPLTRQCLDWSERRSHLAGQLGAALLNKMFERKWFRRARFSRELMVTSKGRQEILALLGIVL